MLEHRFQYRLCNGYRKNKEEAETYYSEAYSYSEQSVMEVNVFIAAKICITDTSEILDPVICNIFLAYAQKRIKLYQTKSLTPENKSAAVKIGVLMSDYLFGIGRLRRK